MMRNRLFFVALLALVSPALAHDDLSKIITLPTLPSMTKAPRVAVQTVGEPFARQIPFWRAVEDVLQSTSVNVDTNITGNAATATALAANGTNCTAGQYAAGVDASGNAEGCATPSGTGVSDGDKGDITVSSSGATWTVDSGAVAFSELSGTATDAQIPNNITITNATASDSVDINAELNSDATTFPLVANSAGTGTAQTPRTDNGLTYDAVTNSLSVAGAFSASNVSGTNTGDDDQPDNDGEVPNGITVDLAGGGAVTGGTATKCARFDGGGNLIAASGDCASGDTTGSVSDGDKGDVTVSGGGATWTVDSGAVDFSELAGSASDSQIPNNITVDNATNADAVDIAAESTDTTSFPVIADSAGAGTPQVPRTDNGLTYNASTNALGTTSLTLSSLTSGRVTFATTAGLLTDDSNFLFDSTTDTLTTGIFQQSTNNSGGFYGKPTSGTNDYRFFVNSSNEWELRQNIGGVVNATYKFGGSALYPGSAADWGIGTASAGVLDVYFDDGGGDTARIVAPALSADITLTLPAATGTLATLAGTETLSNKTLTSPTIGTMNGAGSFLIATNGPNSTRIDATDVGDSFLFYDTSDNLQLSVRGSSATAPDQVIVYNALRLGEMAANPSGLSSGVGVFVYTKGDKFIVQFNDGGTVKYRYMDLASTNATWTYSTTAP